MIKKTPASDAAREIRANLSKNSGYLVRRFRSWEAVRLEEAGGNVEIRFVTSISNLRNSAVGDRPDSLIATKAGLGNDLSSEMHATISSSVACISEMESEDSLE